MSVIEIFPTQGSGGWLALLGLRATFVLLLAAAGARLLRRASAAARHAIWTFAAIALLVLPILSVLVPRWELAVLPAPVTPPPAMTAWPHEPLADASFVSTETAPIPASRTPLPAPSTRRLPIAFWLWTVWILGAVAGAVQLGVGAWLVRGVARRAEPVDDPGWLRLLADVSGRLGLIRPVRLLHSASVAVPVVFGYRRPAVLLPCAAEEWPEERRRAFLWHELAHVQRHDCLTQMAGYVARALYWPHPLAWWATRCQRREAERACDDQVLGAGTRGSDYAHHLLEAARALQQAPRPLAVLAVVERSRLEDRLLALLDPGLRRGAMTRRGLAFGAMLTLSLVGSVAALQPVARAIVAHVDAVTSSPLAEPSAPQTTTPSASTAKPAAGPAITGIVKGPDGRPIAGALVIMWSQSANLLNSSDAARTGATGEFRIVPGQRGSAYHLRVEAPGLLAHTADNVKKDARLEIALRKGLAIEGVVLDAKTRQPIAEARVTGKEATTYIPVPATEPDVGQARATTDAKGRYRLEGLGPGAHSIRAVALGYGTAERRAMGGATGIDLFLGNGASISGTVTGPDRRPAAGVRVSAESELPMASITAAGGPSATADERGRFRLLGLEGGSYRLLFKARDLAPTVAHGVTVDAGADRRLDVQLDTSFRLRGRLVDSDRRPVEGLVRVQELDGAEVPRALASLLTAETAPDGRFEIQGLPAGGHALGITPQGFPPKRVEVSVGGSEPVVDIGDVELPTGPAIRGRVRDRAGAPIAEAGVMASQHDTHVRTRSDTNGAFLLGGLQPGVHEVQADAPGYVFDMKQAQPDGPSLDFVLDRAGSIAGILVDPSGKPVVAYSVLARPTEPRSGQNSMVAARSVGADGAFQIEGLLAGPHTVRIYAEDFVPHTLPEVRVEVGRATDVGQIVLSRGGSVRGSVTDGGGRPIPGAEVSVFERKTGAISGNERQATGTDRDGRFELRGLTPGTLTLRATHPQYCPADAIEVSIDPAQGPAAVRFTLTEGGRIAGVVRRRTARGAGLFVLAWPAGGSSPLEGRLQATIGEDGSYVIEHAKPGRAQVVLLAGESGNFRSVWGQDVEVREGDTTSLDISVADVRVQGRVSRGDQPMASFRLELSNDMGMMMASGRPPVGSGPERMRAVTGEDGSYEMIVPVPGRYNVRLSAPARSEALPPAYRTVEIPDADTFRFDIALLDSSFSGLVLAADTQKPIASAGVTAIGASGEAQRGATLQDGHFELALPPGAYKAYVWAQDYVREEIPIEVATGQKVTRTVRLTRGASLKARLSDSAGKPITDATVIAASGDGRVVRSARTKVDGSVEVTGLGAGAYNIFAGSETGFALQEGVAASEAPAALTAAPGARVRFQFRDEAGKPLARTRVSLELLRVGGTVVGLPGLSVYSPIVVTDEEGAADAMLPFGRLNLGAYLTTRADQRAEISVEARPEGGAAVPVTLRAPR